MPKSPEDSWASPAEAVIPGVCSRAQAAAFEGATARRKVL